MTAFVFGTTLRRGEAALGSLAAVGREGPLSDGDFGGGCVTAGSAAATAGFASATAGSAAEDQGFVPETLQVAAIGAVAAA